MSLITDERASRARLREIQRLTLAIQKARVRKNARRQESRALSLQWIGTNPGVGYAACRLPAACGWQVAKVYKDHGISGAKGRNGRPAFDTLCRDATKRQYNSYGIRDFCDDRALNSLHFL